MSRRLASARAAWPRWVWPAGAGLALLAAGALHTLGRVLWCKCGEPRLWSGEVQSMHNSQHLLDPYSLTHVSHGLVYYWALAWLLGRRVGEGPRLVIAVAIEALWEVVENTSWVIERYRAATISLDYYGDSIANALGDILISVAGYLTAAWLPGWGALACLVALEALCGLWIRDGLALNVLMLLRPVEAIKTWQRGG